MAGENDFLNSGGATDREPYQVSHHAHDQASSRFVMADVGQVWAVENLPQLRNFFGAQSPQRTLCAYRLCRAYLNPLFKTVLPIVGDQHAALMGSPLGYAERKHAKQNGYGRRVRSSCRGHGNRRANQTLSFWWGFGQCRRAPL